MKYRIEQKPAFEAVGYTFRATTVGGANMTEIPKFWDRCHSEGKVRNLAPLAGSFGILGLCADFDDRMERFTYVIGVEAEPGVKTPPGAERVNVPAATYAVFSCVGAMPGAIQAGWNEIMGQWFPQSDYVQSSPVN